MKDKTIALLLCIFLAPLGFHRYALKNYNGVWFFPLFEFSIVFLWLGNFYVKKIALVSAILFLILYILDIVLIAKNKIKPNNELSILLNFVLFIF